jgi:hypothetical protein
MNPRSRAIGSSSHRSSILVGQFFLILVLAFFQSVRAQDVTLQWDPPSDPNVMGYNVHYGTASRSYSSSAAADASGRLTNSKTLSLAAGTWFIAVASHDANGGESPYSNEVSVTVQAVANKAPVANAGADQVLTLVSGQSAIDVTLNGSGSSDTDGTVVGYTWSGSPDPLDTAAPSVSLSAGKYTFTLVVTDDKGTTSSPDSVSVTVEAATNPTACAGSTIWPESATPTTVITPVGTIHSVPLIRSSVLQGQSTGHVRIALRGAIQMRIRPQSSLE